MLIFFMTEQDLFVSFSYIHVAARYISKNWFLHI